MDSASALELARILGSLASMVSAYVAVKRRYEQQKEKQELNEQDRELILMAGDIKERQVSIKDIEIVQALPKHIGDAAKEKINRVLKRYSEAIRSPISTFELDRETELAEFEICHTLRLIKKHNQDKLPTRELRDLWEAFNCGDKGH